MPAKSTLIVVPVSILEQWEDEITNNVCSKNLKYFTYRGVQPDDYQPPAVLSQYDIILTTYETLRTEIYYAELSSQEVQTRRFRHSKRYVSLPSPLVSIGWWRVCVDEAQMVENVKTNMSKMAHRFPAVHRWCVTGTPIVHNLQDLYGLITFLGIEPTCEEIWWNSLVMDPFRRNDTEITANLLGQIFWRTAKRDVQAQMRLPRLTEIIHRLELSPSEMFSYKDRCRHWSAELEKSLKMQTYDPDILEQKMSSQNNTARLPFQRLRKICCHPQLEEDTVHLYKEIIPNRSEVRTELKGRNLVTYDINYFYFLTIRVSELLTELIKKVGMDCVVNYKVLAAALNSLAGLEILAKKWTTAATKYYSVLSLADSHKDLFNTEGIEYLHAMTNLDDLIRENHDCMESLHFPVFRQDSMTKLKEIVLNRHTTSVANTCAQVLDLNSKIWDSIQKLDGGWEDPMGYGEVKLLSQWWVKTLNGFPGAEHGTTPFQKFVQEIKRVISISHSKFELETRTHYNVNTFDTIDNLRNAMQEGILDVYNKHTELMNAWIEIKSEDPNETLEYSGVCHLGLFSKTLGNESACRLCEFGTKLVNYESVIHREFMATTHSFRGISIRSITEDILHLILTIAKKDCGLQHEFNKGQEHMKLFKAMKDQCKCLRKWFDKKREEIIALDTMNQDCNPVVLDVSNSSTRLDAKRKSVKASQLDQLIAQAQLNLTIAKSTFEKSVAEYQYLKMLEKYNLGRIGYVNPDSCACSNQLGQKWGFLPCGHCICEECADIQGLKSSVCMECEREFNFTDIRFIDTKSPRHTVSVTTWNINTYDEIYDDPVTKVEAILRTLMTLKTSHPNEKVLIVSSWESMLDVLENAFYRNRIPCARYKRGAAAEFRKSLKTFRKYKNEKNKNWTQVLLMPLAVASTGLNLTEATHIFLVEPILNLSWEQQAIGRIHRLGQKRDTFVHRFYVAGTVEEKLHQRGQTNDASEFEEGNLTVGDLKELLENT